MTCETRDHRVHVMQASLGMNFGGMERVIIDLYRHVNPDRFRFSVCCLNLRGPLGDEVEADGVPLIVCEKQTRFAKYTRGLELARLMREHRVDILHTHNTTAFVDGAVAARIAGPRVMVHTDHSKDYAIEKKRWIVLEHMAARVADQVVAVSRHTRDELEKYVKIDAAKLMVIHNGINITSNLATSTNVLRGALGLGPQHRVIGTIGRLEPQKGLDLFLAAIPRVAAAEPDVRFIIVGGGSLESALREQAMALGIADRVIFTGYRLDAVELMRLFDCFVQTSHFEGLPMVLLEAMALSKPVVATAVGGVPEAIEHDFNGLLIHGREPDVLSDALIRVIGNPERMALLGRNGRRRYEQRFTAQAMAAAYESLYERFLTDKKVRAA
jgi:glycosyltransferase involved in cell wall biosynthesis